MADTEQQTPAEGEQDSKFHYYSGGEIKEQATTPISPWYWALITVVVVGGLAYFLFGGAMGPRFGGFKPTGGSTAELNSLQQQLTEHSRQVTYASVDLNQLPLPQGQNLVQAVDAGSQVYQNYCIGCHGPNQDGNGVNASSLQPKPRNLRDAPFMQAMSYQRITTSLHKGVPGTAMPRWENTLTDAEIGDVIAYVFSLTSPAPGTVAPVTSKASDQASGANNQYANGTQNSPKPMTTGESGNPAADTSTAPPSTSGAVPPQPQGAEPDQTHGPMGQGANAGSMSGTEAPKGLPVSGALAGGSSVTPPLQLHPAPTTNNASAPAAAGKQ